MFEYYLGESTKAIGHGQLILELKFCFWITMGLEILIEGRSYHWTTRDSNEYVDMSDLSDYDG